MDSESFDQDSVLSETFGDCTESTLETLLGTTLDSAGKS